MKAVIVDDNTKFLSIGEVDDPGLGVNDLLVNVKATAINRADIAQKYGKYPVPAGASPILGLEMAGVIEKIGSNVNGWKVGDRVCALLTGGGYAEKVVIPAQMAIPIPESFSFEQAAAIPEVFLTAYHNLFLLGDLKPSGIVLIHAGASGVGTAAIQLVREAGGSSIITAGSDEKVDTCLELGANYGINYKKDTFSEKIEEITDGRGVNIILDFIGANYFLQNIDSLTVEGRLVLIGTMGGNKVPNVDLMKLMMKRIKIFGSTLRSQTLEQKTALTQKFVEFAMPRFLDGRLKPIIDSIWDINEVNKAHEKMERNENKGKIVLRMNP